MATEVEGPGALTQNSELRPKLGCANHSHGEAPCKNLGRLACEGCFLVTYCSKSCQESHWSTHKRDCKSPLKKRKWVPSWVSQGRMPSFVSDGIKRPPMTIFGTHKYLWGNVPAIDVIQLRKNEGEKFSGPLHVLFAASGDIRNAVVSITGLPRSYRGPLCIVINDVDIDVVARNMILLLVFFVERDPIMAAEYVIHLWYSMFITEPCHELLQSKLKPMVINVCNKISEKPGSKLLRKTWVFEGNRLRLTLTRDNWFSLLSYFDTPPGITMEVAQQVRRRVVSAPERIDYVDRVLSIQAPSTRLCIVKFREDGILLPFSQSRHDFTVVNPTFFHLNGEWPMMDNADPRSGWSLDSYLKFDIGRAKNDQYGKLYYYLKQLFADFHRRLRSLPIEINIFHMDARNLEGYLDGMRFDRIDVNNISDAHFLGVDVTLRTFRPLLQPVTANRHATLITLFLNAVADMVITRERMAVADHDVSYLAEMDYLEERVLRYMPRLNGPNPANFFIKLIAQTRLYDMDAYFDRYMKRIGFTRTALAAGLQMKRTHTIIDPWPMRFSGGSATPEVQDEFALLVSSDFTGQERYVEWRIADDGGENTR
ncbi:hypothetical protein F5Y04DRAFT_290284 [Hypomontagnella monticulosa]|nr:hypothetical protein F5Y04DRAFT_290284 [Hypomontagnella monticulosa]